MFTNQKKVLNRTTIEECVHKIKLSQPILNAVVSFVDIDEQYENASKIQGLMAKLPIVVKDNFLTRGYLTTASSYILNNYVGSYDATVIKKLKDAGAVIVAKSALDELGMGGTGTTPYTGPVSNPYDVTRMAGGSSAGSAALVASGLIDFALGTDTGDSVRKPASFCGIVGVKPTYGRISRYGVIPYASSLDHVGYFTRSVEDAAVALQVCAGRDDFDMTSSHKEVPDFYQQLSSNCQGKRIVVLKNVIDAIDHPETLVLFNQLMDQLASLGAIIDTVSMDSQLIKTVLPTYYIIANCEAAANHSNLDGVRFGVRQSNESLEELMIQSRTEGFGPLIRKRFVIGSYGLKDENQDKLFRKAQKIRRLLVDEYKKLLANADVLVAPASAYVAPKLSDSSMDQLSSKYLIAENYMVLGNFSGFPSMTVPMGFIDGLPIGININANAFDEQAMFDVAFAIEKITGLKDSYKEVLP